MMSSEHGSGSVETAEDDYALSSAAGIFRVSNVEALRALPPGYRQPGLLVWVEGYYESGDPGAKLVRYEEASEASDNGGTVHAPADGTPGRWVTVHEGIASFRIFGIFGPDRSADDALDAMVGDGSIYRIEAGSDLKLVRRHTFSRSGIELDFNGFAVYSEGIEQAPKNDPFAAVLLFRGTETGDTQSLTLSEELAEMTELFEVADSSAFAVGDWWIAQSNNLAGSAERELDKLIRVTEIVNAKQVRFNYKNGWALSAGRTVTYRKVNPVVRASVRNMTFYGAGDTQETGSHPLAYEFAVECDASGIDAYGTFWPVIMRRYCTHYVTERCSLTNPTEVVIGGTGYLTQQIYCLYGHVRDCLTSNGRHLNDFTGSAYGYVENCHADGDDLGAFVTHGQYEHDLVFIGNSGLMSFANSGPTWGESAKRITVKKHVGSWFIAHRKVTDLTLEDVHVFIREGVENSRNTGAIWLNADGVQMKNCTAEAMVKFVQVSARSKRPNIAENCSFTVTAERRLSHENVEAELSFRDCRFSGIDGNRFAGAGAISFRDCKLQGTHTQAKPLYVAGGRIVSIPGRLDERYGHCTDRRRRQAGRCRFGHAYCRCQCGGRVLQKGQ
ncbi:hypothetical protein [Paenibacillus mendelii]|uniref:Peptidase C14 n=1 Tax=Paenibacillus mendelii TaxID=206163 RepID=A0ABV6J383_9BACL|nr:hypothetical protein [Paenibacillus mendelii]MCQ6559435.1 hypothetical protein [Paenibacillus mendelii]